MRYRAALHSDVLTDDADDGRFLEHHKLFAVDFDFVTTVRIELNDVADLDRQWPQVTVLQHVSVASGYHLAARLIGLARYDDTAGSLTTIVGTDEYSIIQRTKGHCCLVLTWG
jgi:hypothetical protein